MIIKLNNIYCQAKYIYPKEHMWQAMYHLNIVHILTPGVNR